MKVMAYQHALLLGLQTLCHAHERKRRAYLQYHQHSFCEPKHVAEDTKGSSALHCLVGHCMQSYRHCWKEGSMHMQTGPAMKQFLCATSAGWRQANDALLM